MRKFLSLFLLNTALVFICNAGTVWTSLSNSLAGENNDMTVSGLFANENVFIELQRPDQSIINFPANANEFGVLKTKISGIHLQNAGLYTVKISRENLELDSEIVLFSVLPNIVSAYKSNISISKNTAKADSKEDILLTIKLKDAFGNNIPNSKVLIYSSRNEDIIYPHKGLSSENGEFFAKISSAKEGVSQISVLAGETLLFQKPEIVFYLNSENKKTNSGSDGFGKYLKAQLFEEETQAVSFKLSSSQTEVRVSDDFSVTVEAMNETDGTGEIVKNYLNQIRFTSTDDAAILPQDYTFIPEDEGKHVFALAVQFKTPGTQTITVHEIGEDTDFRVTGTLNFNVLPRDNVTLPTEPRSLTIESPADGDEFNTARITISGKAYQCETIKINAGKIELINELPVDSSNNFVYQTPGLADGKHIFTTICNDDPSINDTVSVLVDRAPPKVLSVSLPKDCVDPLSSVTITVGAGEAISAATCSLNNEDLDLTPQDTHSYIANIIAPNEEGNYLLSCKVSDFLGNQLSEENAGVLKVCKKEKEEEAKTEEKTEPKVEEVKEPETPEETEPEPENSTPTTVSNLTATNGEIDKVTLFWSPAIDDKAIQYYKINYGLCGDNELLDENFTPDNRTQWYVTPLEECKTYCFQVTAYDNENVPSIKSDVVQGTPFCPEPVHTAPPKTGNSKNVSFIAILLSMICGYGLIVFIRKKV